AQPASHRDQSRKTLITGGPKLGLRAQPEGFTPKHSPVFGAQDRFAKSARLHQYLLDHKAQENSISEAR
ncbi:hypothetical protein, partial [Rhizobium glycinendophyticum]|uniref:hypothetical protein n=1 Tax=Rhizobium glycinendophyticum TaxID=2589807 RepID=UPI001ABFA763